MNTIAEVMQSQLPLEQKLSMVAPMLRSHEQLIAAYKGDEEVARAKRSKLEADIDWLKDNMRENMDLTGTTKLELAGLRISAKAGAEAVQIDDESAIPSEYFRIKKEIDKAGIKKAIKAGTDVPGAQVVPGKTSITIELDTDN